MCALEGALHRHQRRCRLVCLGRRASDCLLQPRLQLLRTRCRLCTGHRLCLHAFLRGRRARRRLRQLFGRLSKRCSLCCCRRLGPCLRLLLRRQGCRRLLDKRLHGLSQLLPRSSGGRRLLQRLLLRTRRARRRLRTRRRLLLRLLRRRLRACRRLLSSLLNIGGLLLRARQLGLCAPQRVLRALERVIQLCVELPRRLAPQLELRACLLQQPLGRVELSSGLVARCGCRLRPRSRVAQLDPAPLQRRLRALQLLFRALQLHRRSFRLRLRGSGTCRRLRALLGHSR